MFKGWNFDDWANHILFGGTLLLVLWSFIFV